MLSDVLPHVLSLIVVALILILVRIFYKALFTSSSFKELRELNIFGIVIAIPISLGLAAESQGPLSLLLSFTSLLGVLLAVLCLALAYLKRDEEQEAVKMLRIPVIYAAIWILLSVINWVLSNWLL